ncbi:hypothetical protein TNCV_3135891 [Trichonephila clavipes]|nr:hypothetical protein TNCV_3135891 [Trichonephila clavipes]
MTGCDPVGLFLAQVACTLQHVPWGRVGQIFGRELVRLEVFIVLDFPDVTLSNSSCLAMPIDSSIFILTTLTTRTEIGLVNLIMENPDNTQEVLHCSLSGIPQVMGIQNELFSLNHLNSSRTSDDSSNVIKKTEEPDSNLREFPFNLVKNNLPLLET